MGVLVLLTGGDDVRGIANSEYPNSTPSAPILQMCEVSEDESISSLSLVHAVGFMKRAHIVFNIMTVSADVSALYEVPGGLSRELHTS